MPGVSRPARLALLLAAGALFLVVSLGVARALATSSDERAAAVALLRAQARGDLEEVRDRLGCPPAGRCAALGRTVRRAGGFEVLRVDAPTRLALGSRTAVLRIAWRAGGGAPTIQCVTVRRDGSLLKGFEVEARSLGPPLPLEGSC